MDVCPNCQFALIDRPTYCPYCGLQLTHPLWKKVGAWILLFLIGYGLVKCHLRLLEGFGDGRSAPAAPTSGQIR